MSANQAKQPNPGTGTRLRNQAIPKAQAWRLIVIIALAITSLSGGAEAGDLGTRSVSAGANHTCRIGSDGELACWSYNDAGLF